jgi:DUF971 family protein
MATNPVPIKINLQQKTKLLHIIFDDQTECKLSCEFLRVYSPSAEVQGHHPSQAALQTGKENVNISKISPVGRYAIKLHFSDGHDTGLFTWAYLYNLAKNYDQLWLEYIMKLDEAGVERKVGNSER